MRLLHWLVIVGLSLSLLLPVPAALAEAAIGPVAQRIRWAPAALAWPRNARSPRDAPPPVASASGSTGLQEVAPPGAVQQLRQALAERQPRVRILAPADGALLGEGPWELKLQVDDWPLVDAGPLGLGPHLLVQIDDQPPWSLVSTQATLPPLAPGSHRLTVMAVRPWQEVVKAPGAWQQIRLHRLAVNPLALPAPASPQLLPLSPSTASAGEPVLLDWLLLDTPLQNLRSDDTRWRLRVTVNGDSFLVQNPSPLWLKGWRRGSNPVLLELVDGRGEPLNPPFNSLVREVRLDATAPRPPWLAPRLEPATLAQLLGEAEPPAPSRPDAADAAAEPQHNSAPPAPVPSEGTAESGSDPPPSEGAAASASESASRADNPSTPPPAEPASGSEARGDEVADTETPDALPPEAVIADADAGAGAES